MHEIPIHAVHPPPVVPSVLPRSLPEPLQSGLPKPSLGGPPSSRRKFQARRAPATPTATSCVCVLRPPQGCHILACFGSRVASFRLFRNESACSREKLEVASQPSSTRTMSTCKACDEPLVLRVDEDEDEGANNENQTVPDDLELQCGCHFHWYSPTTRGRWWQRV